MPKASANAYQPAVKKRNNSTDQINLKSLDIKNVVIMEDSDSSAESTPANYMAGKKK